MSTAATRSSPHSTPTATCASPPANRSNSLSTPSATSPTAPPTTPLHPSACSKPAPTRPDHDRRTVRRTRHHHRRPNDRTRHRPTSRHPHRCDRCGRQHHRRTTELDRVRHHTPVSVEPTQRLNPQPRCRCQRRRSSPNSTVPPRSASTPTNPSTSPPTSPAISNETRAPEETRHLSVPTADPPRRGPDDRPGDHVEQDVGRTTRRGVRHHVPGELASQRRHARRIVHSSRRESTGVGSGTTANEHTTNHVSRHPDPVNDLMQRRIPGACRHDPASSDRPLPQMLDEIGRSSCTQILAETGSSTAQI